MSNKPSSYGASGIFRTAEPTFSNGEGSAISLSSKGGAFVELYPLQLKVVENGGYTYVCFATPGTAASAAAWKIFRADSTGNILYAGATSDFIHVATDPTLLTYGYTE